MGQQSGMRLGHIEVINLNRSGVQNCRDKTLAGFPPTPLRQLNANPQLGNGDRRYCDIITVVDRLAQRIFAPALGVDQDSRIEN
jgi:hypothetical protein